MEERPKKLLDQVRDAIRLKHYSLHTEQSYVTWIKRDMFFHDKRQPKDMGGAEIEAFLTHLAVRSQPPPKTRPSARCHSSTATCSDNPSTGPSTPSVPKKGLPAVLTKEEALKVIGYVSGPYELMAKLRYGTGLGLMKYLRLRVKDDDVYARAESRPASCAQSAGLGLPFAQRALRLGAMTNPSQAGQRTVTWSITDTMAMASPVAVMTPHQH